ncbi:oligopeptide transport system substrate-binding protein [Aneurinibacillus soli]|uniref:Oligopeptide-binding protein OppA n=1 Tax=Aneurinibacillus soli TaxID=1500254 RepID=A0A0U5BEI8_9BACL|nr:peptide ABC transporter substrate-binding protein [Aneurinibacillus soli]PYE62825.1 oligopeptide transport system substrate-binding protein [Aneurinibacillus soli]BAU29117.1 Oligopeptide-binding protein OppA precursor [Aneurinibacillus soli]
MIRKMQQKSCAIVASVLLMLILAVTGCDGNRSDTNASANILNVNNSSEPGSLHPAKAQGTHESWPLRHLFVGLTMKDPDGKVVPGAAKKWDISSDKKTYTFHLRVGQQWSNGDPVTAQDFEFAWKHVLNPATASDYAYQLYYIEGAQVYNESREKDPAKMKALADKVAVKALDEKTLEVKLVNPTPYFDQLVSFYTYYPIDKNVQESNPKWANDASTFVSNGPFKLTEWKHKRDLKMVKNESYFEKDKIKLAGINWAMVEGENTAWQMYRAGKLDLAFPLPGDVVGQLKSQKAKDFKIAPEFSTYFYRFNTTKKPFTNAKIRTALAMAIDRTIITEHIAQGGQKPAYALVAEGARDANGKDDFRTVGGDYFTEHVEQAKRLLAEGLREEGLTSMPTFNIMYNTLDLHKRIAEAIAGMWKQNLGIDVGLENTEFKVKIDREHKLDYSVARSGWVADFSDPMTFLDMFTSISTQNDTGWKNKQYDAKINTAKQSSDPAIRMKVMHDAEAILMKDMPIMPIYFYTKPYAVKENVVGVYTPADEYPILNYADIK